MVKIGQNWPKCQKMSRQKWQKLAKKSYYIPGGVEAEVEEDVVMEVGLFNGDVSSLAFDHFYIRQYYICIYNIYTQ